MNAWRDRLNLWLTPLARTFPLSPNALSALALFVILLAAASLAAARSYPHLFLVAVPLVAIGGLLDALDGAVARTQQKETRMGDFLDHFFDRIADLTLISCWCIGTNVRIELALLALLSVSLNGYLGTQIEATFGQRIYEGTGRGEFVLALTSLPLIAFALSRTGAIEHSYGGLTALEWATVILSFFALLGVMQRFRRAIRFDG